MKVPFEVLRDHNAAQRKYKYHVDSPLSRRVAISSLEFITGINARGGLIDRCLKLHVDLSFITNGCKFNTNKQEFII